MGRRKRRPQRREGETQTDEYRLAAEEADDDDNREERCY